MKNAFKFSVMIIVLTGMFSLSVLAVKAQDQVKVAPNIHQKVLLDNAHVRIIETTLKPGEVIPWHSHPNYVVYVIEGGKIETTVKGKAPETREMKAGEVHYTDAVTHMNKNVGTTETKVIVIEMKPEMAKKKM
ncbi:cupin domain-containing protein [Solitalea koreensis]|uniref:Mannose-6-phosphate isomerase, cupin superfamily n=1 Tax=Solitalea koreensis TaxID=543615 RepID=A0A521EF59_9SPHI|nr:cupin domain-containing protein [Solitalea koreensis]SMO82512.1 Mannose-6-phosphate isomerase, cupin superfamily [Solitalea koreensis]